VITNLNIGDSWAEGHGIFETIRVEDKKVIALHRHHCRAKEVATRLGFEIPSEAEVTALSYQVINSYDYQLARLRWHFDRTGEFSISYVQYSEPVQPAKLMIFDERDSNYEIQTKEYPYKNLELLKIAYQSGFDDGIIIREDGQVAETSIATLFMKISDNWITPPLSSGILNGVTRALCIEAGIVDVQRVDIGQINDVQSALLITSLRNSQMVGEIAGRRLELDPQKSSEIHQLMNGYKGL
jgi:branched-subunit amino acid aminotransferase/4-amino-4-deoxychorismate lyase